MREQAAELALQDMLTWLDRDYDESAGDVKSSSSSSDDDDAEADASGEQRPRPRHISQMNPEGLKSERCSTRHNGVVDSHERRSTLTDTKETTIPSALGQQRPQLPLKKHERIGIFDATNSTNQRRQWILERCTSPQHRPADKPTGCVFIESICDDEELLLENFHDKIANSPDYNNNNDNNKN